MVSVKQFFSKNLFALICGIICALIATAYTPIFRDHLHYQMLWELFAFLSGFAITLIFQKRIENIELRKTRIAAKIAYTTITSSLLLFFIYPLLIVIVYPPPTEINRHSICCETPIEYGATRYEQVILNLDDGVKISGWYVPSAQPKDYLIILIHGHWNDRRGTLDYARYLIKAGYPLFIYDQRGNGESEGELNLRTDLSKDLLSIRNQLKSKYSFSTFGAVGLSMGAHTVINAFSVDNSMFKAVWLDGLTPQSSKDYATLGIELFMTGIWEENLIRALKLIYKNPQLFDKPIVDILTKTGSTDIMLVSGGDEKAEASASHAFAKVNNSRIKTWLIPNGGHLTGPHRVPAEYEKRLVVFFDASQH